MITGFDQFNTDPDTQLLAYSIAADGYREDAVRSACKRFIRGEVKGHKAGKLPTVAEFSIECKAEHSALDAIDWKSRRKALPKPQEDIEFTPEHRAKMVFWFGVLSRSLRGDRQAKALIDGKGWRS